MLNCNNLFLLILILGLLLLFKKSNKMCGGAETKKDKTVKKENNSIKELNNMIINNNLTDNQKLEQLKDTKTKLEDDVKKNTNIYNNLLTNLSTTDDEIENAELDLEDTKNKLSLAEINLSLKESLINQSKNKKMSKNELMEFYVKLNQSKQYNLQLIILMSKIRKLRKNTIVSPNDSYFKNELMKQLENSIDFAKINYSKTEELYKLIISSSNRTINNYKSDISNSKNIAKELKENLETIKNRYDNKEKLNKEIKDKLSMKKEPEVKKLIEQEDSSLFDNLSTLFQSF